MTWEAVAAGLVALAVLLLVLYPSAAPAAPAAPVWEPEDLETTPRGVALAALREIEFDRATGKLSDEDYEFLSRKYTAAALEALREDERRPAPASGAEQLIAARVTALRSGGAAGVLDAPALRCVTCGPRAEADARFCSECGELLVPAAACAACAAPLPAEARFCDQCGVPV